MALSGFNTPSQRSASPACNDVEFSGAPFTHVFSGILSDMDGTLVNSTDAIVKHWENVRELERTVPIEFGADAVEIAGARTFLTDLGDHGAKWAIVTSGTRPLVEGWLSLLKLAEPKRMVTAEDVKDGKPDPECYRLGKRLGVMKCALPCLVLEDAPAGIRAGKAAGCPVLAVATTHRIEELIDAGADWVVRDLTSVSLRRVDPSSGEIFVEIRDAIC